MTRLRRWVRVTFSPSYWMQNHAYSARWDRELSDMLDAGYRFHLVDSHSARIGNVAVWIANHPYASFTPYGEGRLRVRPRRTTIYRAYQVLLEDAWPDYSVRPSDTALASTRGAR